MLERAQRRFLDVLASVYIYNEHRGYSSIDRVLEAVYARHPGEKDFIAAVEKHRSDERKHYLMFRRYFEQRGYMPYRVDKSCGHIDRLIRLTFGCDIDDLDTRAVIASDALFFRLCRIIMLTEIRGMNQLEATLFKRLIAQDAQLVKIYAVIRRDEPSHWQPYKAWLEAHGGAMPTAGERAADEFVHWSLVYGKVPALYLNAKLPRRTTWPDESDGAARLPEAAAAE